LGLAIVKRVNLFFIQMASVNGRQWVKIQAVALWLFVRPGFFKLYFQKRLFFIRFDPLLSHKGTA